MEVLAVRGKRDMKPFLLSLGFALALSFTGFLVSHLRSRRRCGAPSAMESETRGKGLKDALRILKSEESLARIINGTSTTTTTTTTTTKFVGLSPRSRSSGDEEGFLLSEFNDLVLKEFEASGRDPEGTPTNHTPKKGETRDEIAMEQEIEQLKNLVISLRERERSLEVQLLEYYGLEEQEAAMRELESQVKINTMEAKIFCLKIESVQAENQRLQAQLLDYSKTLSELEAARAKVKFLKRKLKIDGEEAREKMATLQRKISTLQSRVEMDGVDREDFERKLKRLKELEDEALDLRILNSEILQENLELNKKLEGLLLEGPEAKALEESKHLKEANDKLTKEIEQLQTDRCTDVEELVYLRWVNACLRYELRNYQPTPGKTMARDLSKSLSPKSEEKAKQLIVEYANSGADEKTLQPADIDMGYYSSSQASAGESDDTSNDIFYARRSNSSKSKFFSKLKTLVLGKDRRGGRPSSASRTPTSFADSDRRTSFSTYSVDDMSGRDSSNSLSPTITEEISPCNQLSGMVEAQMDEHRQRKHAHSYGRSSLDVQGIRRQDLEENRERKGEHYKLNVGRSCSFRRLDSLESSTAASQTSSVSSEGTDSPEKMELKKFAEVLNKSRIPKHKKWASSGK